QEYRQPPDRERRTRCADPVCDGRLPLIAGDLAYRPCDDGDQHECDTDPQQETDGFYDTADDQQDDCDDDNDSKQDVHSPEHTKAARLPLGLDAPVSVC
ncbi:MAG: hypothetical protein ACTIH8_00815, partial [Microbacterium gubbeenense]